MTWLITTDTHLSDRPRDGYRFGLFGWLAEQQRKYDTRATFLLGDLTHEKDYHSATLVNRTIEGLTQLRPPVYILRGNHDGLSPDWPFFEFLNCVSGFRFVVNPLRLNRLNIAMIPHCRSQDEFDQACHGITGAVMCHQTFDGAIAESGAALRGLSKAALAAAKPSHVWAGDVHRPQQQGIVTYVGAPYHVRFGDDFEPRVLLVTGNKQQNLYYDCPKKWVLNIKSPNDITSNSGDLKKGDQIKVNLWLKREDALDWLKHKSMVSGVCRDLGLEVYGIQLKALHSSNKESRSPGKRAITPEQVFLAFCKHEGLADGLRDIGRTFVDVNSNHRH